MRYPDGHKEEIRARIIAAASKALRRHGLNGVSIPALMKQVGLTHGGFYVHFRDREELAAAAIGAAAAATAEHVFLEQPNLAASLRLYLSKDHVDHPADGCVLAALGTDASRQPAPVRVAFAKAARGLLELVEDKLHPRSPRGKLSDDTLERGAKMIGAIVLARLVADEALAERILSAAAR